MSENGEPGPARRLAAGAVTVINARDYGQTVHDLFLRRQLINLGEDTVNEAYARMPDLPGSTEQIITPSDYERDLPTSFDVVAPSLPGYQLERESVWGELGFRIMIDQVLGEDVGSALL